MSLPLYLAIMNIVTFLLYWRDKRAARAQAWRVPEFVLLLFGFLGGTLGAFIAQKFLRHKTAKQSFRLKFWALTAIQIALIVHPPMMVKAIFLRFFH